MFVPLEHPQGHAQVDFGEGIGIIGGVERKIHFFAFDLPHSDACFVVGYPAETTEAFCDGQTFGHSASLATFPQSILYDNTKIVVARTFSAMEGGDGRVFSPSCNRTTYSRIVSVGLAKATTKAKSRGWSAMPDGTSLIPIPVFESFEVLEGRPLWCMPRSDGGPVARPRRDDRPKIGARSGRVPETTPAAVRLPATSISNEGLFAVAGSLSAQRLYRFRRI